MTTYSGHVVDPELIGAKQAYDQKDHIEQIGQNHSEHEAHKVEEGALEKQNLLVFKL